MGSYLLNSRLQVRGRSHSAGGDSPSHQEGQWPGAIESTIPSLPSMRGRFTPPFRTSRPHTSAQVEGAAEDRVVGRGEVTRSAVSGKSLARRGGTLVQWWCSPLLKAPRRRRPPGRSELLRRQGPQPSRSARPCWPPGADRHRVTAPSGAAQKFVERGSCCLQGAGRGDCSRSVSARNQQPVTVAASASRRPWQHMSADRVQHRRR